jgi:hypothetical protein
VPPLPSSVAGLTATLALPFPHRPSRWVHAVPRRNGPPEVAVITVTGWSQQIRHLRQRDFPLSAFDRATSVDHHNEQPLQR